MRVLYLVGPVLALLAGCGADGAPIRPEPQATPEESRTVTPVVQIRGTVSAGVSGGRVS